MTSEKESGLPLAFGSGNGDIRIKTLPEDHLSLQDYNEQGGSDGDGQSAKPDDVIGDATPRPERITDIAAGTILSANFDVFNKSAARTCCPDSGP